MKNKFGMEINPKNQKQFDVLRVFVQLSEIIDEEEIRKFFEKVFRDYYPKNPVLAPFEDGVWDTLQHRMKYFSFFEQDLWDLWYMYTFNYVMNYAYNIDTLGNDNYIITFSNTTDSALKKLVRSLNNMAVQQTRESMAELEKQVDKKPPQVVRSGKKLTMHITFIWQSREDAKVCTRCDELEGQTLLMIPEKMPHPNCRCDFVVYEWWTDPDGKVVADRSYEVEQNKTAKGNGIAVKRNKVTSKLEGGKQITIFEVQKDGKTTKKTYTKGDK